jgi:N-hydroxyarylamine O-acetyltransferase
VDLDAYFARIGYEGDRSPTLPLLTALHRAHAGHIPFENVDVLLGRPIRLDLDSLQAKLVRGRRGGYCFEQNALFAGVLEALGFRLTRLAARVRFGATGVRPRSHMNLLVEVDGSPWLADVGFGGDGLLEPLPLVEGRESRQAVWTYRLMREDDSWVLQSRRGDGWFDLYSFTLEPQYSVDYEVSNYFTATHPDSIFRKMLTAQRTTPEARYVLRNRTFTVERAGEVSERTLKSDDELLGVLAETFGLEFPPGTRFPLPADKPEDGRS